MNNEKTADSKHTSGKWEVKDGYLKSDCNKYIVPVVDGVDKPCIGTISTYNAEWEANARLIASAPDLLEALERIKLLQIRIGIEDGYDGKLTDEYQIAKEAILKATYSEIPNNSRGE